MSNSENKIRDLANMSEEKLREMLVSFKKELFHMRFQKTLGDLKNTSRFALVKKNIARINTEFTQRQQEEFGE